MLRLLTLVKINGDGGERVFGSAGRSNIMWMEVILVMLEIASP